MKGKFEVFQHKNHVHTVSTPVDDGDTATAFCPTHGGRSISQFTVNFKGPTRDELNSRKETVLCWC